MSNDAQNSMTIYGEILAKYSGSEEKVVVPEGIEVIGKEAFFHCVSLKEISLPSTLKIIEDRAFSYCTGLTGIHIPYGVIEIGKSAFFSCFSLREALLPPGLLSLGKQAFSQCEALQSIDIPASITELQEKCFHGCKNLIYVGLPDSIKRTGENVFLDCPKDMILVPRTTDDSTERLFRSETKSEMYSEHETLLIHSIAEGTKAGNCINVFICPSTQDYRKEIQSDLFSIRQDLCLWRLPDLAEDCQNNSVYDDELCRDLLAMRLFVVPVTKKLFTDEHNNICLQLIDFAKENQIPILPIILENGLLSWYSEIFGQLEFLAKVKSDATALSYKQKLSVYLNTVLVDREIAEEIRSAFDLYIFLSYRKKDRVHANSLMRIIHSNPRFRDVAIWYDEYLTPGEDFHELITKALKKSKLFAMVVTPNLLEKENYVMQVEYPMAMDNNKDILAFECDTTDEEALAVCYPEIPDCISAMDEASIIFEIDRIIGNALNEIGNEDPYHLYLMGLAYMSGIDVEIDKERGRILLEKAARKGVPEAGARLVSMCETGDGTSVDLNEALNWQILTVENYKRIYEKDPCKITFRPYWNGLLALCTKLQKSDRLEEALDCCDRMQKIVHSKGANLTDLSTLYFYTGDVLLKLGKQEEALAEYESALDVNRMLVDMSPTPMFYRRFLVYLERIIIYKTDNGELEEAEKKLKEAFALGERLRMSENHDLHIRDLSNLYCLSAGICAASGHFENEEQQLRKAMNLREELYEKTNDSEDAACLVYLAQRLKENEFADIIIHDLQEKGFDVDKLLLNNDSELIAEAVDAAYDADGFAQNSEGIVIRRWSRDGWSR